MKTMFIIAIAAGLSGCITVNNPPQEAPPAKPEVATADEPKSNHMYAAYAVTCGYAYTLAQVAFENAGRWESAESAKTRPDWYLSAAYNFEGVSSDDVDQIVIGVEEAILSYEDPMNFVREVGPECAKIYEDR